MKVLLLNTNDISGGAARAAFRLHQGLKNIGLNSLMLVQAKNSDDTTVVAPVTKLERGMAALRPSIDSLPLQLYRQREKAFYSPQWLPSGIAAKVNELAPNLINLHWICQGFLSVETIFQFSQPIVWTLHDMWAFTGGCHYTQECDRYTSACGNCPQLNSNQDWDLSRWIWQRKTRAWKDANLTIVTPSRWLAECARTSSLFQSLRIEVIPNGIDIHKYKPLDKQLAKNFLGLSPNQKLILFSAVNATSDRRKGFHFLLSTLQKLSQSEWQDKFELMILGSSQSREPNDFGFKVHHFGKLSDDISLSLVYASADVLVAASTQENLSNTVMEALACGTPCVVFKIGGMPDMIEHRQNGYLAQPFDIEDLGQGIVWVLENRERHYQLCAHARKTIEQEFALELQAQRYRSLFEDICQR